MPVRESFTVDAEVQGDRAVITSVERVQEAVEEAESSSSDFGDTVSKEMRQVASSSEDAEAALRDTAAAQERVSSTSSTLSSTTSSTANALGFELVQASSDARFGMVGLANQLPLIQEQFLRLQQQSGSTTGALSTLAGTFLNPGTGIIAAVTLFLTFKEPLLSFFTDSEESAKSFTEEAKKASAVLKSLDSELEGLKDDQEVLEDALAGVSGFFGDGLDAATETILSEGAGRRGRFRAIENLQASLRGSSEEAQRLRNVLDAAGVKVETLLTPNIRQSEKAFQAVVQEVQNSRDALERVAEDPTAALAETPEALARAIEERLQQVRQNLQAQQESPIFDTTEAEAAEEELETLREAFEELIAAQEGVSRTDPAFDDLRERARQLQQRIRALKEETEGPILPDEQPVLDATDGPSIQIEQVEPPPLSETEDATDQLASQFGRALRARQAGFDQVGKQIGQQLLQAARRAFIRGDITAEQFEQWKQAAEQAGAEAGKAGQQAFRQSNRELVQGIRLASRLGETLVRAFQKGEVEANKLLGQLLQIVGSAVAIANPAAGAAISGAGGILGAFDEGGYTGDGARSAPAGVVHRGEYVMPADVVSRLGVGTMRQIHAAASAAPSRADLERLAGVPGYATGGLVTAVTRPATDSGRRDGQMTEEIRRLREDVQKQTQRLEQVKRRVNVPRRSARTIYEEGEAYSKRKSAR